MNLPLGMEIGQFTVIFKLYPHKIAELKSWCLCYTLVRFKQHIIR